MGSDAAGERRWPGCCALALLVWQDLLLIANAGGEGQSIKGFQEEWVSCACRAVPMLSLLWHCAKTCVRSVESLPALWVPAGLSTVLLCLALSALKFYCLATASVSRACGVV